MIRSVIVQDEAALMPSHAVTRNLPGRCQKIRSTNTAPTEESTLRSFSISEKRPSMWLYDTNIEKGESSYD